MRVAVVIPAHNEEEKICGVARSVISCGYDVVVVDDGSRDNTFLEALKSGAVVLRHIINRGYGAALETGNRWALKKEYDVIVHFDADEQHDPFEIKNMVLPVIREEADVVIGSRFIGSAESIAFLRKVLIKSAIVFTWIFSGIKLSDAHNGLRAFSSSALKKISCAQDGMSYASEIIDQVAKNKFKILEVPVTIKYTDYSMSKGEGNFKKIFIGIKFLWSKFLDKHV